MRAGDGRLHPNGIGSILRKTREDLGLTVDDVASQTRIAARFLNALESNRHEDLPSLVFTRNFVRQYAVVLKLDPEPLLNALPRLDESHIQLPVPPRKARSARWDSREKSLAIAAVWLCAIALAGFTAWQFRPGNPLTAFKGLYGGILPKVGRVIPPGPAVSNDSAAVALVPAPETPPVPAAPSFEAQRSVLVVVKANQESWVSLAADGKSAFSGVLKENESRQISAAGQVKLVTGNAGGVTISLNGKEPDPIGPAGQVRVIRLTAEGPEFLARTPRPEASPL